MEMFTASFGVSKARFLGICHLDGKPWMVRCWCEPCLFLPRVRMTFWTSTTSNDQQGSSDVKLWKGAKFPSTIMKIRTRPQENFYPIPVSVSSGLFKKYGLVWKLGILNSIVIILLHGHLGVSVPQCSDKPFPHASSFPAIWGWSHLCLWTVLALASERSWCLVAMTFLTHQPWVLILWWYGFVWKWGTRKSSGW